MKEIGSKWRHFDTKQQLCSQGCLRRSLGYFYEMEKGEFSCEVCAKHGSDQFVKLYEETHANPIEYYSFDSEDYARNNQVLNKASSSMQARFAEDASVMCQQKFSRDLTKDSKEVKPVSASEWEKAISNPSRITLLYFNNIVLCNALFAGGIT